MLSIAKNFASHFVVGNINLFFAVSCVLSWFDCIQYFFLSPSVLVSPVPCNKQSADVTWVVTSCFPCIGDCFGYWWRGRGVVNFHFWGGFVHFVFGLFNVPYLFSGKEILFSCFPALHLLHLCPLLLPQHHHENSTSVTVVECKVDQILIT